MGSEAGAAEGLPRAKRPSGAKRPAGVGANATAAELRTSMAYHAQQARRYIALPAVIPCCQRFATMMLHERMYWCADGSEQDPEMHITGEGARGREWETSPAGRLS